MKWVLLVLLVTGGLTGWALLKFSSDMVAPPRPRVSDSTRPVLGLELRQAPDKTIVVERAVPPASKAGLRRLDRIVRLDDEKVESLDAFAQAVSSEEPGHLFRIEARRGAGSSEEALLIEVASVARPVSPADVGLLYEDVSFPNPIGLALRGWYIPPPPSADGLRAPAVAYGHGNGSDRRSWLGVAPEVHEAGFAQLLFDFAGRGESEGEIITLGARESLDLRAALDWLASRSEVDAKKLALIGRSMGGAAAILEAADDPRVKALVLDSPFADLVTVVDETLASYRIPPVLLRPALLKLSGWRAQYDPYSVRPVAAIARVRVPILLFHGDKDTQVPFHHGKDLRKAAGGPLTWVPLEGLDHNSPRPADFGRRAARFLAETLHVETRAPRL